MGGIAAVLGALVVVVNQLPGAPPPVHVAGPVDVDKLPPASGNRAAINEYFSQHVPFMDPVPLGKPVAVSGDPGLAAILQASPGPGPTAFIVLITNIRGKPIDGSFSSGGAWLESGLGERFYPPQVRLLSFGNVPPAAIGSRAEVLVELVFTVPARVRPARLILSLRLGSYYPNAQWDLPSTK
jgi:hypothetical protein